MVAENRRLAVMRVREFHLRLYRLRGYSQPTSALGPLTSKHGWRTADVGLSWITWKSECKKVFKGLLF
jgi:hypothetical protein